jgi:hypothetical protein
MTTFPKNNLPTGSLNWSREVEKAVNNLESTFKSAEINNVTRDAQLQNSYKRLDGTLTQLAATNAAVDQAQSDSIEALQKANLAQQDVNDIIQNIYVDGTENIDGSVLATATVNGAVVVNGTLPGGKIQANTITANQISTNYIYAGSIAAGQIQAGTVNGLSITGGSLNTTPASGKSVSISGSSASFQNNGSGVGSIEADGAGRLGVFANSGVYITGGSAGVGIFQGNLSCEFDAIVNNGLRLGGSAGSYFTRNGAGQMEGPGFRSTGNVNVAGNFFYDAPTATGTTYPLYVNITTNQVYRLSSSARYKTAIQDAEFDYDALLQAKVRTFKNKQEVQENGIENAELTYGYIAEELHDLGLTEFVVYESDDNGIKRPESVNYMSMALATHEMLKVQDQKLKSLEARLTSLEDRVQ